MPIHSWGCLQVKYVRELTLQFVILKQQSLFSENAQRIPIQRSQGFAGGKKVFGLKYLEFWTVHWKGKIILAHKLDIKALKLIFGGF